MEPYFEICHTIIQRKPASFLKAKTVVIWSFHATSVFMINARGLDDFPHHQFWLSEKIAKQFMRELKMALRAMSGD
jgi:hypothetical protein